MSAAQVGFGLYGALLVEDPERRRRRGRSAHDGPERHRLRRQGRAGRAGQRRLGRRRVRPRRRARAGERAQGAGAAGPRPARRSAGASSTRARSRFFLLDLQGQKFTVIGTDGGLQERPTTSAGAARHAGRARGRASSRPPARPARSCRVYSMLYNRGYGSVEFRSIETGADAGLQHRPGDDAAAAAAGLARHRAAECGRRHARGPHADAAADGFARGHSEFQVNGVPYPKAKPYRAALGRDAALGDQERHEVGPSRSTCTATSSCRWTRRASPLRPMAWKDTINIPMNATRARARDLRRAARHVDVPLPHPRPRGDRPDGHGARGPGRDRRSTSTRTEPSAPQSTAMTITARGVAIVCGLLLGGFGALGLLVTRERHRRVRTSCSRAG